LTSSGWITEETYLALNATLREGIIAGETIEQLSARVSVAIDEAKSFRTERIARTETASATTAGEHEAYIQEGVEKRAWLTARDPAVRPSHLEAESLYGEGRDPGPVPVGKMFELEGASAIGPGQFGRPDLDINCRCTTIPVLED
jgi:uncharacterized protein with gpF-like domain